MSNICVMVDTRCWMKVDSWIKPCDRSQSRITTSAPVQIWPGLVVCHSLIIVIKHPLTYLVNDVVTYMDYIHRIVFRPFQFKYICVGNCKAIKKKLSQCKLVKYSKFNIIARRSCGYGRRLTMERSRVWIPPHP